MVKKRLGEMLIEAGAIDETQLHAALGHQRKWGGKLGQALLDLKLVTEPQIVSALSRKFGYEIANVAGLAKTPQLEAVLKLVPRELALRQILLPIAGDSNSITVAMADPSNIAVVDELSFRTGRRIRIVLGGDREIAAAVRRLYYSEDEPPAIPIEDGNDGPMETTRDPFAAMPDYIREGYFQRPAQTLGPPSSPGRSVPPPPLPGGPPRPAVPRAEPPDLTPPPMLVRPPARAAPQPAPPSPLVEGTDGLGEPILVTELAPVVEAEGSHTEPLLTPRQAALQDALERVVRGEESGLLKPGQVVGAIVRLLERRGLLRREELLEELSRK
jgi:Type II secretion system (T2SS), protein E, N-terminal domain